MSDSDPDEEGSAEGSCEEQQNSEGADDVEEVQASGSRASAKPILRLPERNDDDRIFGIESCLFTHGAL